MVIEGYQRGLHASGSAVPPRFLIVVLLAALLASCALGARRVKLNENFTMHAGERVVVAGAGLTIQLKNVGHQWYVENRAESPFVEIMISGEGASSRTLQLSKIVEVGDYTIRLVAANPFGDRGGPDCELIVNHK